MRCLLQRVLEASVSVEGVLVGQIGPGLLVLVGVEKRDSSNFITRMADRLVNYRIFSDKDGKMNHSIRHVEGEILLVSQFTLAAETKNGTRPSFSNAALPKIAERVFKDLSAELSERGVPVKTGVFGANMQVSLINDGPVSFLLEVQ